MSSALTAFKGLTNFLLGQQPTRRDDIVQPCGTLPDSISLKIHKATNLFRPTTITRFKMDPYVAAYLTGKKAYRQKTPYKSFGGSNPVFNEHMVFPFTGEALLVIQVFDSDYIRDEFIGEVPLDLMPVINSTSRSWTGPVTIYGQKGTAVRGEVWLTIDLKGGDPYDASLPAVHRSELDSGKAAPMFGGEFDKTAKFEGPAGTSAQTLLFGCFPVC